MIQNVFFPVKEYQSWHEALQKCSGYDSQIIIDKVYQAAFKVKSGQAVYERDSVIFEKIQYSWPILSALLWVAAQNDGCLNIIDYGGALGTSYYQNKKFLDNLKKVRWNIVEQGHFVELGKKEFENESLKFYFDLDSCVRENQVDAVLFSGVLQYLENPFAVLQKVRDSFIKFVLVDRTSFHNGGQDKIIIQKVPGAIYKVSFPCWVFSENKFLSFFEKDTIFESFESFKEELNFNVSFKGYIVQLNRGLQLD